MGIVSSTYSRKYFFLTPLNYSCLTQIVLHIFSLLLKLCELAKSDQPAGGYMLAKKDWSEQIYTQTLAKNPIWGFHSLICRLVPSSSILVKFPDKEEEKRP